MTVLQFGFRPNRPLRPGEIFDVGTGRFIRSLSEATGTTRKLAVEPKQCMMCWRPIAIGEEYEEDLALVCCRCTEGHRHDAVESPGESLWQTVRAAVRMYWEPVTALFHRLKPKPKPWRGLKVTPNLTHDELLKIQPDIVSYCAELRREGHPWDVLAGLLGELNKGALLASEYAEALEDVRWRVNEGLGLLREPIEFNSKFDQQRIRDAKDHFTQAHRLVMFARHRKV